MILMKKLMLYTSLLFFTSCTAQKENTKPMILTSLVPFATLLNQVIGDYFQVVNIASNATTAEEIDFSLYNAEQLKQAQLYFSFNLPFEQLIESKQIIPITKIIRLDKVVKQISFSESTVQNHSEHHHHNQADGEGDHHHGANDLDPHIWTSPKQMLLILEFSVNKIIALDPAHEKEYQKQYKKVKIKLETLDKELEFIAKQRQNKEFLVFHPAYGYIAHDYHLKQIAVEKDGKETSLQDMQDIMSLIKAQKISVLFLQNSFPQDILDGLKKETGIQIIQVNPLDKDYEAQTRLLIKGLK